MMIPFNGGEAPSLSTPSGVGGSLGERIIRGEKGGGPEKIFPTNTNSVLEWDYHNEVGSGEEMTTYSMMDALMASPTEPLPIEKRMFQLEAMWKAMDNLEKADKPTVRDWELVSDAVNMMEALRDLKVVEDPDQAIEDAVQAMGKAGMRSLDGKNIRLDGPAISLMRGILEDYCDALEGLPARTVISAHRYAEKRIQAILKGKKRKTDVRVGR